MNGTLVLASIHSSQKVCLLVRATQLLAIRRVQAEECQSYALLHRVAGT